ncbi:MAG: penicillin-binding transpeptidase domain-containing protein [Planctomycetota bacterium]
MVPLKKHKFLVNIIGSLLIIAFIVLVIRIGKVQLTDHHKYVQLAKQQQSKKIDMPARRGMILDRNGTKLAESLQLGSVYADPAEIQDITYAAHQLSKVLKLKSSKLTNLLNKDKRFVWIKRKINDKDIDAVERLSLKGIYVKREYLRFYPNRQLAAHVLGFTDVDEKGLDGIELLYNDTLSGKAGYRIMERDALQRPISMPDAEFQRPVHGDNVVLTIDANIQRFAEEELEEACKKWAPLSATAIVMDPVTAEVLAMANYPAYDPNKFKKYPSSVRRNLAVTDCYELGSVMKPIVVSGLFERGLAKPGDIIYCENGVWNINGRAMRDTHKHGNLTVTDVIAQSSNIGTGKLGMRLGNENLFKLLKQFNFGEKTGIELPGESWGIILPLKKWTECSVRNISIGQGIAVTSMQFITAFCSMPNGGLLLKPSIIKSKVSNDDKTAEGVSGPQVVRRVMSARVARDVMNPILRKVVTDGTAKNANLEEYDVAGKTGTAQKVVDKQYSHTKFIGSFIAYAPAERPRVCVLVVINEPKNGAYYGGTVASPVVREIIARSLLYLKVEPSQCKIAMQ